MEILKEFFITGLLIILVLVLVIMFFFNKKTKKYICDKWPELLVSTIITLLSVFVGACLALQSTTYMNQSDERQNYFSMLKSCEHLNKHYLKNVEDIIDSLNQGSHNLLEMNRLIKNIDQPFLLEEIIKSSDLYKYSSRSFKSWLPEIISFLHETNWSILKKRKREFSARTVSI
jgi:hypothetical protein